MTPKKIIAEAYRLEKKLSDLGYIAPHVRMHMKWGGDDLNISISYQVTEEVSSLKSFYPCGDASGGWEPIFKKASEHIESLKSIKDMQKNEFLSSIAKLIDQGRKIDIDVEFLNPLTEMMGKLSSNIIEKQE